MSGNTIGHLFRVTTFGESHGPAIGGVIDGCPPGLALTEADMQPDLDRRRPGQSRYTTARREADEVQILSGVFEGVTTGTSIGLVIQNTDQRSQDYSKIKDIFRPGHADYTYQQKFGNRDYRGGGRSSARETAVRVAAGAIAKKYLAQFGVEVTGYLAQMGEVHCRPIDLSMTNNNAFFCPDPDALEALDSLIREIKKEGDSIGAKVCVRVTGMPVGLGEPVFDRLDADLAHAMMGINAVKAVSIGDGFDVVSQKGSQHRDEITPEGFKTNRSGGVLGGISTGQDLEIAMALKPTSSIGISGDTVDVRGDAAEVITKGRHDPCVGIRAVPIAEAMAAIVVMDHLLRHRAQNAGVESITPVIPAQRPID